MVLYFGERQLCCFNVLQCIIRYMSVKYKLQYQKPILVSLYLWGNELRNKKILFHCDNAAVVFAVNTMTSKSEQVMTLLRALTLKCLRLNVVAKAKHIPGKFNITDSLSRLQLKKFKKLCPTAQKDPDVIPSHLWNIFNLDPENF